MNDFKMDRRRFVETLGLASLGAVAAALPAGAAAPQLAWKSSTSRKIRVGIAGYGVCRFGAEFGFQDHPNVEVVAVTDLIPERRDGLMKACRCAQSHESLERLVRDPKIEAVFVATDAPNHARHCMEAMNNGKHVMTAVPAVFGSLEDAALLIETVRKTGMKYMMAETSCFHAENHAMRQIYRAGGFGKLVYSEGEYFHYCPEPIDSYKGWRIGLPPLWYPTHATAYYVGVTGGRFTSVSCAGVRGKIAAFQPGANRYNNPFTDQTALFQTSEGGASRMGVYWSVRGKVDETGRVYGEKGYMTGMRYHGALEELPNLERPPLPPTVQPGGHGGAHGYLCHEFVSSILENREPLVNVDEALAMTVPGIIAHQSALKDGESLKIPQFSRNRG